MHAQQYAAVVLPVPDVRLSLAGDVKAVVRQSDGKLVLGGSFDLVGLEHRQNLARFNTDGSLDVSWPALANGTVNALALDAGDHLYVGGAFTEVNGIGRNALAKLGPDGMLDADWNPAPNSIVNALLVSGSQLYVGGAFGNIAGSARTGVARVSVSGMGQLDATWNPAPNNSVLAIVEAGSNVYLGGSFSQVSGTARLRLAKVSALGAGLLDANWNPSADAIVNTLALDGSGSLVVGGVFFNIGGLPRNCIAKLDPAGTGAANASWIPASASFGCSVRALAADGNGAIIAGGSFSTMGGLSRNNLVRLLDSGTVDSGWNPDVQMQRYLTLVGVHAVLPLAGGAVQVGGNFDTVAGNARFGSARLMPDGSLDASFSAAIDRLGDVRTLAFDPISGHTYVGGSFELVNGSQVHRNLLRLANDLSLDGGWTANVNGPVSALKVDQTQRVYAAGAFTRSDLVVRNYLARFDASGVLDATWNPNPNFFVEAMALSVDESNLYLGGAFTQIGGQSRNRLARVATAGTGSPPDSWNPNANSSVLAMALRPSDGAVYVGGAFSVLGGLARSFVGKIGNDGTVDASWAPNLNNFVEAIDVDPRPPLVKRGSAGSIGVGGDFDLAAGVAGALARNGLVNLLPNGTGAFDSLQDASPPTGSRVQGLGAFAPEVYPETLNWICGTFPASNGSSEIGLQVFNAGGQVVIELPVALDEGISDVIAHYYFNRISQQSNQVSTGSPAILVGGSFTLINGQARKGLAAVQLLANQLFANSFE
ncbi:delta-60 repeat domain-containing protein [Ahniella affigens]|nr:delta-60 repeat domain-containing protein [Ahniella affigens]